MWPLLLWVYKLLIGTSYHVIYVGPVLSNFFTLLKISPLPLSVAGGLHVHARTQRG